MKLCCPHCQQRYEVSNDRLDQLFGQTLRCKQCAREFPLTADRLEMADEGPLPAVAATPVEDAVGAFSESIRHADSDERAPHPTSDEIQIEIRTEPRPISRSVSRKRPRRRSKSAWWIAGIGAAVGGIAVVALIALVVRGKLGPSDADQYLARIAMPAEAAVDAKVLLDGEQVVFNLDQGNEMQVTVPAGIHELTIQRLGFEDFRLPIRSGEFDFATVIEPEWNAVDEGSEESTTVEDPDPFAGWHQDLEVALVLLVVGVAGDYGDKGKRRVLAEDRLDELAVRCGARGWI